MESDYSSSVHQKKLKMKRKQHKTNEKDIKETEKDIEDKLNELYVKFFLDK